MKKNNLMRLLAKLWSVEFYENFYLIDENSCFVCNEANTPLTFYLTEDGILMLKRYERILVNDKYLSKMILGKLMVWKELNNG